MTSTQVAETLEGTDFGLGIVKLRPARTGGRSSASGSKIRRPSALSRRYLFGVDVIAVLLAKLQIPGTRSGWCRPW